MGLRAEMHEHALDNLKYIRSTMENTTAFTAVPGYGMVLVGLSGLLASWLSIGAKTNEAWLAIWTAEGMAAILLGFIALIWKANHSGVSLLSSPARRFGLVRLPSRRTYGLGRPHSLSGGGRRWAPGTIRAAFGPPPLFGDRPAGQTEDHGLLHVGCDACLIMQ